MNGISLLLISTLAIGSAPDKPASCAAEVGHQVAAVYVRDCALNSSATHPPCNEANPCSMIVGEVVRSCDLALPGPKPDPKLCERYRKLQAAYPAETASH